MSEEFSTRERGAQNPQPLEASPWRQGEGEVPNRVVLRKVGGCQPFATHIECLSDGPCGRYFTQGHYFAGLIDAAKDFEKRAARETAPEIEECLR
jgi:hypothetical protein